MTDFVIETACLTRYFGNLAAVNQVDLQVLRGSVYGFLGPNGAGKSTTIRLLLGLIQPDQGEVRLFGHSLPQHRTAILQRTGALVETPSLYPHLTGRENLHVTRHLIGAESAQVEQVLAIVQLAHDAHRLVREYSQGMKQRLGLAMALLGEPELLILDEPTNGLDPAGMQEMRALLRHLAEDRQITVFLSSHLLAEVEHIATHIGVIHQGHLCFQGTPDDLHAQMEKQVVLGVDQPQRSKTVLQQAGWSVRDNGGQRLTVAANNPSDAAMINAQLVRQGINVYHLNLKQPTLEDMFMELTNTTQGDK
jgi:ABC-2 type transport system ATP-binding protein